jgi:twitching motility protein PilT
MDYDLVDYLQLVLEHGGSDLHITVGAAPQLRVNGVLHAMGDIALEPADAKDLIFAALKDTQRAELEKTLELDFALQVDNVGRFRGNAHYAEGNVEAAFRFIPETIPDLSSLGHYPVIEEFCHLHEGLILVTGITGSGKSTTLAAMAKRVTETRSAVVVTIEDPIEFIFPHTETSIVKQRQIGTDTLSFPNALRSAMRQDPDVIVVSEMRDLETIRIALTAAETGHLVISTLHTVDAPKSIDRLIDAFPADQHQQIASQLSTTLAGVVSQHLLPAAPETGGRVLLSEIMKVNAGIGVCIRERKLEQVLGLMEIGRNEGMHTRDHCLVELAAGSKITLATALDYCRDKDFVADQYRQHVQQKKKPFWKW